MNKDENTKEENTKEETIEKQDIYNSLDKLYNIYATDELIKGKMKNYIDHHLPNLLDKYIEREKMKKEIEKEINEFTNNFLYSDSLEYYYIKQTELFIKYDGLHFNIINRNDLIHEILTSIYLNKLLRRRKHQIKNNIIKRIKENELTKSIPNSSTIQFVINYITPFFIKDRNTTKYFLTILGDNVLKKETKNIYYLNHSCDKFIKYIKEHFKSYFKNSINIDKSFSYKYEKESHINHRIIDIDGIKINNTWDIFLRKYTLDIFTIAVHYSTRYKSADGFLETHLCESKSKKRILYLKNNTPDNIINLFIDDYIIHVDNISISQMELYYMWMQFLKKSKMPNIININYFLEYINKNNFKYNENTKCYEDITSPHLCYIKIFKDFWEETIILTDDEDELETSELFNLFDDWHDKEKGKYMISLDETTMVSVFKHFYNINIQNNKIIKNISCTLWNKKDSINDILEDLKSQYKLLDENTVSFQQLYKDYCKEQKNEKRIVSKDYFLKYISISIPINFIKNNYILNLYWD